MCLSMLEKEYRAQCAEGRWSGVCFLASSLLTQRRRLADDSRLEVFLLLNLYAIKKPRIAGLKRNLQSMKNEENEHKGFVRYLIH